MLYHLYEILISILYDKFIAKKIIQAVLDINTLINK